MSGPPTGTHLGAKLAGLMHDARVAAATRIIPAETEHRAEYHRAFMEQVEQDLAPTIRAACGHVLEDDSVPEEAKAMLRGAMLPEHQGQFFLVVASLLGIAMAGPQAAATGLLQILKNGSLDRWPEVPLSPDQVALAVLKGATDMGSAAAEARRSGVAEERFRLLTEVAGEPPGGQELMEALRRGYIDTDRFAHGVRQSRVRNEWVDVMLALRFAPPGAGQVLAGAVEGHLDEATARAKLAEAGINPAEFDWLYETAGRPPGIEQMIELWRRGDTDEATVRQAVRESDIKPKYTDAILKFRRHVPPARTVIAMLREGAIDDGKARHLLEANGVMGADADDMVRGAHSGRATALKEGTAAEAVDLYVEGLVDRASAHSMMVRLHYSDAAAEELLGLADRRRANRLTAAAAARVRANFVAHKITRQEAMGALDAAGWHPPDRDHALDLWTLERGTNVRHMTEAQVAKAWQAGLIDEAGFVERHVAMGYTPDDARLLLELDRK